MAQNPVRAAKAIARAMAIRVVAPYPLTARCAMNQSPPRDWLVNLKRTAVRVVFSDESGIDSEESSPNVVVAAVMLNLDVHWPVLAGEIEKIIHAQGHDPTRYELKGSDLIKDLRKAKREPSEKNLKFETQSSLIWAGCLLKLFEHGVPVFVNAVNKAGYGTVQSIVRRHNFGAAVNPARLFHNISPYMAAFSHCLREADNYIHTESPKEQLLWISDRAQMHESDLKEALRSIREFQQMNLTAVFPHLEYPEPRLSSIADTIYFGDSKHSRALQLADLCATTASLHLQKEPLVQPFFDILLPQIKNSFIAPLFQGMDQFTVKKPPTPI
jgi:hypothetical protein